MAAFQTATFMLAIDRTSANAHSRPLEAGLLPPDWHLSFRKAHIEMTTTPAVLAQLQVSAVREVVFFKRDEITTELIC